MVERVKYTSHPSPPLAKLYGIVDIVLIHSRLEKVLTLLTHSHSLCTQVTFYITITQRGASRGPQHLVLTFSTEYYSAWERQC